MDNSGNFPFTSPTPGEPDPLDALLDLMRTGPNGEIDYSHSSPSPTPDPNLTPKRGRPRIEAIHPEVASQIQDLTQNLPVGKIPPTRLKRSLAWINLAQELHALKLKLNHPESLNIQEAKNLLDLVIDQITSTPALRIPKTMLPPELSLDSYATYSKKSIRFWKRVIKSHTHWLWVGASRDGSGTSGIYNWNNKRTTASRIAWELTFGELGEQDRLYRHCGVSNCVRPDHHMLIKYGSGIRSNPPRLPEDSNPGEYSPGAPPDPSQLPQDPIPLEETVRNNPGFVPSPFLASRGPSFPEVDLDLDLLNPQPPAPPEAELPVMQIDPNWSVLDNLPPGAVPLGPEELDQTLPDAQILNKPTQLYCPQGHPIPSLQTPCGECARLAQKAHRQLTSLKYKTSQAGRIKRPVKKIQEERS